MKPLAQDHTFWCLLVATCALTFVLCGCQRGPTIPEIANREFRTAIIGRVTLDGAPLNHCRISFHSTINNQTASATASIISGEFSIPAEVGPFSGENTVTIEPELIEDVEAILLMQNSPKGKTISLERQTLPARYNTPEAISLNVDPASNQPVLIELTSN